jgi:hypothetical protein
MVTPYDTLGNVAVSNEEAIAKYFTIKYPNAAVRNDFKVRKGAKHEFVVSTKID